jgi:hypothetical protein
MKKPLDSLKFWKRQSADEVAHPAANMPYRAATVPAHPTYPTSTLKDFIQAMSRKLNPVVLDIGPVIGSNVEFFLSLGIKIYMEEFLAAYLNPKYTTLIDDKMTLDEKKFFVENFDYAEGFFDGLIFWDFLSYVEPKFAKIFADRISTKMKPDSFILGSFRTQKSLGTVPLNKYRVCSETQLEYIPLGALMEVRKAYQTRDVTQLFSEYESQRFYLLKHNLLEVLLKKRAASQNQ